MELKDIYNIVRKSEGICTDTRSLSKGEVFFALKGPNHDGNRYVFDSLQKGAVAAIADDPALEGDNIYIVEDVYSTLRDLAVMRRSEMTVPVIAVTGTNGKTTTKELLRSVLAKKYVVHATEGNLNNHIGVPVTLLSAPDDSGIVIIEMGANHQGEIAALCEIAHPGFGIITNIGRAHLEGFGSFGGVIAAKSELYHYLRSSGGVAIYNDRDTLLSELIYKIVHKALPYSDPSGTDLIVNSVDDDIFLKVYARFHDKEYLISTNLFGKHNLDNVRAAMAAGVFFGVAFDDILEAIRMYTPQNNRSQILNTSNNMLICDSYNANPSSMLKALTAFGELSSGPKMVILGDMLELGEESNDEHARVIDALHHHDVGDVLLCGPRFKSAVSDKEYTCFDSVKELSEWLSSNKTVGKTILVKGSRGMALDKIYDLL